MRGPAARWLLCAVVALAGCSAGPELAPGAGGVPGAADIAAADARRRALDAFEVGGSLGYWDEAQNLTARFDWRETPARTELRLTAPLGLGSLALSEDAAGATLTRRGAAPVSGPTAGRLLQAELGLAAPLPLEAARDWLRGLPGEGASDVRRDDEGRLESVLWTDASGARWFARVRRWQDVAAGAGTDEAPGAGPDAPPDAGPGAGLALPALVTARSGERRLRLALSDWRLGADAPPTEEAARPEPAARPGGGRLEIPGR